MEKCIFYWFAGGPKLEKLQNLEKCIFCCFAGGPQRYQTLSVLIPNPGKIAKPGKMHVLLVSGKAPTLSNAIQRYPSLSQTLEKLQNLENAFFAGLRGGIKLGKIAKPGKNVFFASLQDGPSAIQRYPSLSQTLKNCKTWKNAFFAVFREGFNAIQRYPSLSQTLEKFQNLEKSIFCCFAGGRKIWKNCKTWKNVFF